MNTGDQELKTEWRRRLDARGHDTTFWNIIHERSLQATDAATHRDEAIVILIDIAERLVEGVETGKCERADLYYVMKLFGDLDMIYSTSGELYDFCDGELYRLMQAMEAGTVNTADVRRSKHILHAELGIGDARLAEEAKLLREYEEYARKLARFSGTQLQRIAVPRMTDYRIEIAKRL